MKTYRIKDNLNLGTLAWTRTQPATRREITKALLNYHESRKDSLPAGKAVLLPSWTTPTLDQLLTAYDLEMEASR